MCPTCKPACTAAGASSLPGPGGNPAVGSSKFCVPMLGNKGSSMYMDGFTLTSTSPGQTCLAFLWPQLLIDVPWKLALACVAAVGLCFCVEPISVARRFLPRKRQRDVGLILYALSLTLAYLGMLLIMTYSYELFLSALVGLILGHVAAARAGQKVQLSDSQGDWPQEGAGPACCRLATSAGSHSPLLRRDDDGFGGMGPPPMGSVVAEFSVTGMTCSTCVCAVERALKGVDGVVNACVCLQTRSARVYVRPSVDAFVLCAAVAETGFGATPMSSSTSS